MKFRLYSTGRNDYSDVIKNFRHGVDDGDDTIEMDTIEDLMQLMKMVDEELIINNPLHTGGLPYIEIYDDYRE